MLDSMNESDRALLLRMHKEATLGRLLSGLLHELRNPLNSISNSAELLEERGEQEELRSKLLQVITHSCEREQKLLDALELHRPEQHARAPIDLHEALRSCIEVLGHAVRYIDYHPKGVNDVALVEGEPHVIWFVLLSLLELSLRSGAKNLWVCSRLEDSSHVLVIEQDGEDKDEEDTQSASLAIQLSRILVQQINGELACSPREPSGSRVTLTLHKARSRGNDQDSLR